MASGAMRLPGCAADERVVVLGGSGFVGRAILRALAEAGFHPVSAHRNPRLAPHSMGSDDFEHQACNAKNPEALMRVLRGAGCVVNAVLGDAATMVAASRALAEAAAAMPACKLVHISSMAVYGNAGGLVAESAPLRGSSRYAAAKIACEAALAGTGAIILRPGLVYGPGGEQWAGRLFRLLRAGRLGDLGEHGDGRCNFVHARDLGAAVVAALRNPLAAGHAINVAHSIAPRWNQVLLRGARAIGAVPAARIPGWRLNAETRLFAPPLYAVQKLAGRRGLPEPITASLRGLFAQDITLDHRLADRLLGFGRTPPLQGLAECAGWFIETYGIARQQGLLF